MVHSRDSFYGRPVSRFFRKSSQTFLLLTLTLTGLFFQTREYAPIIQIQSRIADILAPLLDVMTTPTRWISQSFSSVQHYIKNTEDVIAENLALKIQNDYLIRQRDALKQTMTDNEKLRDALNVQTAISSIIMTVQISHHTHDGYSQTFYTKVTNYDKVTKNDPVLSTKGYLVGRIIVVHQDILNEHRQQSIPTYKSKESPRLVRIMPITDPASRIPVKIEETGEQAILAGRGQNSMEVTHLENISRFKPGQKLVTSGIGGIYPAGIPVAEVSKISSTVHATPLGKMEDQEYALILTK